MKGNNSIIFGYKKFFIIILSSFILGIIIMQLDLVKLNDFFTIYISIVIQSLPFIMIISIVASFIHFYLSEDEIITKLFAKRGLAVFAAILTGIILPKYDVGVIYLTRKILKRNVPMYSAITYLIFAPIINPVVVLATYFAFSDSIRFLLLRILSGIVVALLTGLVVNFIYFTKDKNVFKDLKEEEPVKIVSEKKLVDFVVFAGDEFIYVMRILIFVAALSSFIQVYIFSGSVFNNISDNIFLSILVMLLISFFISATSASDSFIARSFQGIVSQHGILAFMVFGTSVNLRNTRQMTLMFKRDFVIKLISVSFIISFCVAIFLGNFLV